MKKQLFFLILSLLFFSCGESGNNSNRKSKKETTGAYPAPAPTLATPIIKPVVNVYIENSASMDGYVVGVTDFEHAVYSYLSDIKIADIADTINLNYINSEVINFGSDIDDFIEKLEPTTFRERGGNRGVTDISNVLKTVLSETRENDVAVLVSDCVFSPGRGKDAQNYLINQQIGIKVNIAEYLNSNNITIAVYQLSSQFSGNYYNREDKPTRINDRRPFYIWIIGKPQYIAELKMKIPDNKFKGSGVENSYTILPSFKEVDYGILTKPCFGSFKKDKQAPKTHIYDIKKETKGIHRGKFMFAIGADFSIFNVLLGDNYLKNTDNYVRYVDKQPQEDFTIEVLDNTSAGLNYSHNIQLTTDKIPNGDLEIVLLNKIPQWVYEKNDDIGLDIHTNDAMRKTYGIKYLIEGVYEAYEMLGNNYYTSINVTLKR